MVRVKLATSLNILGFLNHEHMQRRNPHAKGTNPCFCGDMRLLTTDGYKTFKELEGKEFTNISYDGSTSKGKVWSNGIKNTVKIKLSTNETIICTPDHRLMTADNEEMEAQHTVGRRLKTFVAKNAATNDEFIKLGFIQGDGVLTRLASPDRKGIEVIIGAKDEEILPYFDNDKYTTRATRAKIIYVQTVKERMLDLGFTPYISAERSFPTTYNQWEDIEKKSFLKGCFSANGTVIRKYRVAYKTTSKQFADQLIEALAEFNIGAYMTTNKSKNVVFSNGEYTCRESYDVNVGKYRDVVRFAEEIGFVHSEKNIALAELIDLKSPKVMSIRPHKPIEVFDFHEPNNHWGVVEGLVAHNCGEILLDDRQTCNLTEINMSAFVREDGSVDMERMLHAQRLSAKIGYRMATIELELHEWDKAGKKDMLTGCSLSGMADFLNKTQMSNEDFAVVLRKLRKVAREEVDEMAEKLKMGKTLLVTTNKPSGCWTKDHTRNFDEGILFIDEINPLIDEKEGFVDISGFHARGFNVPKTYKNELAPIHIITLKNKRELKVSPEHPLAILHEDGSENWVKAKDIVEGMQLVVELGNYKKTTNYKFNKDIKNIGPTTRMYNLPDELTPDIGYLLGAIYANGCFTTNDRIKFSCQHIPLIEKVQKIWKDVFGVEVNITKSSGGRDSSCLDFRSTLIRKFFAINGIDKNADLAAGRIPYAVRVSSAETIRQFILGYADNDGCFFANGFCIDSANKAFMQHMQEVGESVGFCFSLIENSKRKGNFGKGSLWKLGLQRQHITQELCDLVNESCWKAQDRPVTPAKRRYTKPYTVLSNILAEEEVTYDIEVEEEHWYYQGAIKSHNTLSLLPGISAGIHFQHSDYYIRRVRVNEADPLSRAMTEMGFASVPENGQTEENCSTRVFAFPCKAPTGDNKFTASAIRQLELYKLVMENYVEHNASNTISVRPEEWDKVVDWVYDNWNSVVGMTFLELASDYYQQAPYEAITEEEYHILLATTPKFVAATANSMEDFSDLLAADIEECTGGHCPVR